MSVFGATRLGSTHARSSGLVICGRLTAKNTSSLLHTREPENSAAQAWVQSSTPGARGPLAPTVAVVKPTNLKGGGAVLASLHSTRVSLLSHMPGEATTRTLPLALATQAWIRSANEVLGDPQTRTRATIKLRTRTPLPPRSAAIVHVIHVQ